MQKTTIAFAALLLAAACAQEGGNGSATGERPPAAPMTPAEEGRLSFGQCAVCHSTAEGQPHRIGPNLFDIYGKPAGKGDGFNYTAAMRQSGITWTEKTLDAFITDPHSYVPGNRMAYLGEADAETRANIIAYLKTLRAETN